MEMAACGVIDVVIGYSKWIKEQESMREMGNDNRNALLKMKYQVIHLFSAGQIERSFRIIVICFG